MVTKRTTKEKLRATWGGVKEVFKEWSRDDCLQWGAALAYYAVFSFAPILLIIFALSGFFLDENVVEVRFQEEAEAVLGEDGAAFVSGLTDRAVAAGGSTLAVIGGLVALLVGATGAFAQLSIALNRIWGIRATGRKGWVRLIRKRIISLGFVLVVGFLFLVSLVADTALSFMVRTLEAQGPEVRFAVQASSRVVLLGLGILLFALIYRYLPDAKIKWSAVWPGAVLTAILFELGKYLFRLYVGHAALASSFGAAGTLVLILVWVWFASQIVFIGAETNQVLARRRGEPIEPEAHAERIR